MMYAEAPLRVQSRALHIVHITGSYGPQVANGIGRAVYFLSEAQRSLGHHVTIVNERAEHVDVPASGVRGRSLLKDAKRQLERGARRVSPLLARELLAIRPDVVHFHSIHVPENVSLSRYLRAARVPYCVTVHGGLSRAAQNRGRVKKAAMWWLGEREYLDGALFVHALTNEEAEAIWAYGVAARTVVAPNGIDADLLPQATRPEALFALAPELAGSRILAFMGRLAVVQKGLDVLVRGMALANLPDVRLVLLGPDWRHGRADVQRLVDRLGLQSRVSFFDAESPQRCADLMAGVDVFVHTSRWEGMALAILEAAVWQKPCLLTRAADPGGTLGRAGGAVIVEPTPESVADGIRRLCSLSRAELRAMGCRARSTVSSRFRWSLTASTLARAYGESLAKP